jgi:predicted GNAT superfamily acetyltransferase
VPAALLWAAQRVGGVASGAFDTEGTLVGLVFGISGWRNGRRVHWSDLLAVRAGFRGHGLGVALKLHQRALLLEADVDSVGWTFDPLESRNAWINFSRLGITAREYIRDVYGESASPLHQGVGTDRMVADWRIGAARVAERLTGDARAPTTAGIAGLPAVLAVDTSPDGMPVPGPPDLTLDAPRLRLPIPSSIQELKARGPELGALWRERTRTAFEAYFGRGYVAAELVRSGAVSDYVLTRTDLSL